MTDSAKTRVPGGDKVSQSETDAYRCHARLLDPQHRCSYRGKVEVDGKWYCGTHDPQRRKAIQIAARSLRGRWFRPRWIRATDAEWTTAVAAIRAQDADR